MPGNRMNDDELIRRWREGDEDAFWELHRRHRPECFDDKNAPMPKWLYRIDRRQLWRFITDFENLFDEVFLKTVKGYDATRGSFRAYLARNLQNAVVSRFRRECRRKDTKSETDHQAGADEHGMGLDQLPHREGQAGDPAWLAAHLERLQQLEQAIARLSQADQDIINRRFRDEQDYSEIAREYGGISESTCRSKRERAVRRLRGLLEGLDHEE